MFDEGFIVLRRISLSEFGGNRKLACKRRILFDKLYLMAEFNPQSGQYGHILTTTEKLTYKLPILTIGEVRGALDWLHDNDFIHKERASKYCNNGYLIKINHYDKLNKTKVLVTCKQTKSKLQATNEQLTSITSENNTGKDLVEKAINENFACSLLAKPKTYLQHKNRKTEKQNLNTFTETCAEKDDINLDDPISVAIAPSKPVKLSKPKSHNEGKSVEVVNAYKSAYRARYGVDPIINAATRSQACKLVDSVGKEAAPKLAEFYLTHNAHWYIRSLHKFGLLLSDAEKLHTEMKKGEYMTDTLARKADKQSHDQTMLDNVQKLIDSDYFDFDPE